MDWLLELLYTDPVRYVAYVFAFFGACGVLLFFIGFGGGIGHLFTFGHSQSHMDHARARIVWGLLICMVVLGLWEALRVIVGDAPLSYLILVILLLTPVWVPWVSRGFKSGDGGH